MAKRPKRPATNTTTSLPVTTASVAATRIVATPAAGNPGLRGDKKIAWQSVFTVMSAAVLIGAEVFGGAFAGGWAVANLLDLGQTGVHVLQGVFFIAGMAVMVTFIRHAQLVEPFFVRD